MKAWNRNSFGLIKSLLLAGCFAFPSTSMAEGPVNDWSNWKHMKVYYGFTNAMLCTMNGHSLPAFATDLFPAADIALYGDIEGKAFGVGEVTFRYGERETVIAVHAKGSLSTRGESTHVVFTLSGRGPGVGNVPGKTVFNAKFVQTKFTVTGPAYAPICWAEGKITGTVRPSAQELTTVAFEDEIAVRLDSVPGRFISIDTPIPQLTFDVANLNGRKMRGCSDGTDNCFGRYEDAPVQLRTEGSCNEATGEFVLKVRGLGHSADAIRCEITGTLESAPAGCPIRIDGVVLKGKAYGQRLQWYGSGLVLPYVQ